MALIIEDEAARGPDDLYRAVRPMLAVSGGRLILMSTPFGKRGHFFEEWEQGGPGWDRVKITAHDCPRISPDFLEEKRRSLPDWFYRQEYLLSFEETVGAVFSYDDLEAAFTDEIKPLFLTEEGEDGGDPEVRPLFERCFNKTYGMN